MFFISQKIKKTNNLQDFCEETNKHHVLFYLFYFILSDWHGSNLHHNRALVTDKLKT